MTAGNVAESASSCRREKEKEKYYLAGGNHARSECSHRRYYAVRIVRRRPRSPWALDRDKMCCVFGQASNRTRASFETERGAPRQCCRRRRTTVKLSIAVTECARRARERIFTRMEGGFKAHSKRRSVSRRVGRAPDTTIMIRRVCDIVVTVYLVLILVVLSRLT